MTATKKKKARPKKAPPKANLCPSSARVPQGHGKVICRLHPGEAVDFGHFA